MFGRDLLLGDVAARRTGTRRRTVAGSDPAGRAPNPKPPVAFILMRGAVGRENVPDTS